MNPSAAVAGARVRRRVVVTGVVQGVGFRPFVHRLATELALDGAVWNDPASVVVEVEGDADDLDAFVARLWTDAPPLANVEAVETAELPPVGSAVAVRGFRIVESTTAGPAFRTLVPPDVAVCDECLAEVLDPGDRRYRYPFANCTNCGPRFTIIRDLPYDRPATTMAGFPMCPTCATEYRDWTDRRYHAQPIACPACGPTLAFERDRTVIRGNDPALALVQLALARGEIVAVKGVGGYHLACDARLDSAVERLRERKGRVDKPFAVMVPDLAAAHELVDLSDAESTALLSPARPIVLARRRSDCAVAAAVAPDNPLLGVLLPYTPLHHLLFRPVPGADTPLPTAIVLTSGNVADEPICYDDREARERLAALADAFCTHDRPIHVPCDDSVMRVVDGVLQPVRRSRGYAPLPVALPVPVGPVLAVGGELKNTFCVASGRYAWVGQHVGDMGTIETLAAFERSVDGFERMYGIEPSVVAADLHPGYSTRRWALVQTGRGPVVDVQHHHAHVAAVMAEHGLDGTSPVIGVAFDGTGYGLDDDGAVQIWGGEILVADYAGYSRVGHLRPLPLPGGDGAVRNPCRIAVAYLRALDIPLDALLPAVAACDEVELRVVCRQVERDTGCVPTTSMGRLFDAVSSLLGIRHRVTYEAQAAIQLEASADAAAGVGHRELAFAVDTDGVIDPTPVLRGLVAGVLAGEPVPGLARAFHRAVASAVLTSVRRAATRTGPLAVALTGGVFQNALLARLTRQQLDTEGFEVLTHRLVPPNDGGLSLGQAVIAGAAGIRDSAHSAGKARG